MLTLTDYFGGRDVIYKNELTPELQKNAAQLVQKVNQLLARYYAAVPDAERPRVTSGWRPAAVNMRIPNAAPRSKHMQCQAIDLSDPEGDLDDWCMQNLSALEQCGLYLEHPSATKSWCHLQSVAPRSQRRVFYP